MNEIEKRNMPKGYIFMWVAIVVAYLVWMLAYMKDVVLVNYNTIAERTVDGYLQPDITGIHSTGMFLFWTFGSAVILCLFPVYIKKILYADKLGKAITVISLILLVFGCVYINWYGLFDVTKKDGTPAEFVDKVTYITASMTGLQYPWHFRGWAVFASSSIFINTMYAYNKYGYNNRLGVILGSLGSAAIFVTVNCPSWGETKNFARMRCVGHWLGAVVFAACCAMPLVFFLFSKARKEKGRYLGGLIAFGLVLVALGVLTVAGFKSAIIENIPMTAAYILLFMFNFTHFFDRKKKEA